MCATARPHSSARRTAAVAHKCAPTRVTRRSGWRQRYEWALRPAWMWERTLCATPPATRSQASFACPCRSALVRDRTASSLRTQNRCGRAQVRSYKGDAAIRPAAALRMGAQARLDVGAHPVRDIACGTITSKLRVPCRSALVRDRTASFLRTQKRCGRAQVRSYKGDVAIRPVAAPRNPDAALPVPRTLPALDSSTYSPHPMQRAA